MKKINLIAFFISSLVFINFVACGDKKDLPEPGPKPTPNNKEVPVVSQFVYDGLSAFYLWNEEMKDKKPTVNDSDAKKYFQSVLHKTDIEHGWSWITDDVEALAAGFQGEPKDFGYVLTFIQIEGKVYAFVKYVYPNTPASNAELERLDLIGEINGNAITTVQGKDGNTYINDADLNVLFGSETAHYTIYNLKDNKILKKKEVEITPTKIKTNPVLIDTVYRIGNKKIGYLFYTSFIHNYNTDLFDAFQRFKQQGITDLVLDLRYNHGGAVTSASYLSSLIAPRSVVESRSPLAILSYNSFLNASFDKWYKEAKEKDKYKYDRKDYFRYYLNQDIYDDEGKLKLKKCPDPLGVNLNLSKVYIIATGDSFSASELTTFCLKPYMDVIHIGSKTGGKYTASWTLHAYDSDKGQRVYDTKKMASKDKDILKNWAMQPIVARYTDKNGKDFIATDGLIPEPDNTLSEGWGFVDYWTPLGDVKDVLLGQAIYLITGDEQYKPSKPNELRSSTSRVEFIETNFSTLHDKIIKESVILDNPKISPSEVNQLLQLRKAQIQEEEE